jgi:large subunit ribosomal protein L9
MMEVILLERVEKLGQMGQVVKVRPGFARNFLLPQKKALRANKANMAIFQERRAQLEAANLERRGEAEQVSATMNGVKVVIIRQAGESGQLYGSVTARDIAMAITEAGFTVTRGQVVLDKAIKTLGLYPMRVVLHPEVSVQVIANVAQSAEEAEMQAKGVDPVKLAQEAAQRRTDEEGDEAEAAASDVATEEPAAPKAPKAAKTTKAPKAEAATTAEGEAKPKREKKPRAAKTSKEPKA